MAFHTRVILALIFYNSFPVLIALKVLLTITACSIASVERPAYLPAGGQLVVRLYVNTLPAFASSRKTAIWPF